MRGHSFLTMKGNTWGGLRKQKQYKQKKIKCERQWH
jgi:hypothetical protein